MRAKLSLFPMTTVVASLVFAWCQFVPQQARAYDSHALLIGVSGPYKPLEGPRTMCRPYKKFLWKQLGFPARNIVALVEEQATKAAILARK